MLLKLLRTHFYTALKDDYPETEIQSFFNILADYYLGMKRIDVSLNLDMQISIKKVEDFKTAIEALKNQVPIQHIVETTEFYGLPFKVSQDTLIPRPETEELVEWIIDVANHKSNPIKVLDVGTGTGCIAIALAKHLPNATVYAVDISKKALTVAKTNAELNKTEVLFKAIDILNWKSEMEYLDFKHLQFDIVVSNPPYVRQLERAQMSANVLQYEPDLALYVEDDNPLLFYKSIVDFAKIYMKNTGHLFFEINQYLGEEMVALLQHSDFSKIELKKDIFGNDRMVSGVKNF